jgi:hypothetical protein
MTPDKRISQQSAGKYLSGPPFVSPSTRRVGFLALDVMQTIFHHITGDNGIVLSQVRKLERSRHRRVALHVDLQQLQHNVCRAGAACLQAGNTYWSCPPSALISRRIAMTVSVCGISAYSGWPGITQRPFFQPIWHPVHLDDVAGAGAGEQAALSIFGLCALRARSSTMKSGISVHLASSHVGAGQGLSARVRRLARTRILSTTGG